MGWNLQRRAFWDSEMLIRAQQKGYRIKEVPVIWVEGPKSYISIQKEKSMVSYILLLKFRLVKERKINRKKEKSLSINSDQGKPNWETIIFHN